MPWLRNPKSEEHKANLSAAMVGKQSGKNQPHAIKIQVTDLELDISTMYDSMNEAARAFNINALPLHPPPKGGGVRGQ